MTLRAAHLNAGVILLLLWDRQCSDRYITSLFLRLHNYPFPLPPFSLSLIRFLWAFNTMFTYFELRSLRYCSSSNNSNTNVERHIREVDETRLCGTSLPTGGTIALQARAPTSKSSTIPEDWWCSKLQLSDKYSEALTNTPRTHGLPVSIQPLYWWLITISLSVMINYSRSRYRVKASSETTFRSLAHLPLKKNLSLKRISFILLQRFLASI